MSVSGKIYYKGSWQLGGGASYHAVNPATGKAIEPALSTATAAQVDEALEAAQSAFLEFRNTSLSARAAFLRACAEEIMALGDELLNRVSEETGYPLARAQGERARTCGQLNMFADYIERGEHLDARIDTALPERTPLPRPDLRFVNQALGPVVVFGASNFPLAFSVAGGDTASALAAGCPVLVKGHSSHPGTSELVAQAIARAADKCKMPAGVFSLLMGSGAEVGSRLVEAPVVKAVGFTGSLAGGMALFRLANARPEPIPVFAEMGSVNPVVLLPQTLAARAEQIASGFVGSLTLGTGQFCVNPGLVLALDDEATDSFVANTRKALENIGAGVMLNERICSAFCEGIDHYTSLPCVEVLARGQALNTEEGFRVQAALLGTSAEDFLAHPEIHEEIFGPVSLLVRCKNMAELMKVVAGLGGQLTATVHADEKEIAANTALMQALAHKVGRVVINGFPTGVEVCEAMVHGGPFPASTDTRFTSVGTAAIKRFLRPICYQNYPQALLPEALQNANPLNLLRTINGEKTKVAV